MTDQTNALLVTVADPFNTLRSRKLARLEVGRTIFETLVEKDYISMTETGVKRHGFFYVTLNGKAVLQKDWNTVISDNDCVGVWTLPQGGGGGSNIGVILITVVMVAAAVFTGGATLGVALAWGAAAGAAVGLLTSLVPAPSTPASGSSIGKDTASSTYTISAQGNTVRVGEAIKVQYGRMRVWPDLAAQPYTETRGNAQYVYQLMVLGQGKLQVERIQIEDSDINSYGEIEYEIIQPGQPVTLFPDNVITSQAVQGLEMLAPDEENFAVLGPYVTSPPGVKTTFIAVDIQLPQGAYKIDDGGNNQPRSVQIGFWAQPINDAGVPSGARQQIVNETLTFSTKTPQMISYKVEMPEGRYQVDGQRMTLKPPDNRTIDKVVWSGLKGYAQSARTFGNVTMIATIIKATNNLNSNTSRRVNTIQTRMLPTWDPVNGWGAEVPTSNPAWAYADALRNSDYGPGWGTNRINMAELYRLSQIWGARGDEFNGIYDNRGTLWQALTQIAMVGRATPQYYAGVMDIVRDEPKTIPAQLFSPGQILQNTFKGSYKLGTMQTPDHVIVKFWNRETWQEDEVLCALPGSTTKVPYTKDMTFGVTDHDHAWREGMYAAAVNRDQRSRNSFTVEMPGLLLRFGDLIHVTHDVPGWGYPGKVISFNPTTGKVVTTEPLVFTAGSTHYITFRRKNGKADGPWQVIADPNPTVGVNSAIVQGTVAARQQIFISNGVTMDLTTYAFGPADRESNKMVVLSAKPNAKGETQITVCDYVTSTHIADQGGDVPVPPPISNLPGAPVGPIVNRVTVEMTTTVGEQQIVAEPANGATYYEFEGMSQGGGNWSAFGVSGDPFLFVNLDAGPWIIRVRGVGAIPGPWATWTGTIALTSLPLPRLSKLTATGKIFAIDLAVDYAEETRSISKTLEIWAGRTNVLGNATLLVKLPYPATAYTHSVNRGADQWYYFARVIDTAGRVGPWFNNGAAVPGMSSMDADPILDQIAGEVTKDILGQELQKEIELITAPATVVGSVNNRVNQVSVDLGNQIQDLSTVVNQNKQDVVTLKQNVTDINSQITNISKAGLYQANQTYATGKSVRTSDDRLYTAIKAVPVNTPPPNTAYWLDVGQVAINENGSAGKITQITTRVDKIEGVQTSQATLLQGLRTDVDGKASQTAFNQLDSKVTQNTNSLQSQGNAITSLTSEVNKKADATAVQQLATTVNQQGIQLNSQSTSITNLSSSIKAANSAGSNTIPNASFDPAYSQMGFTAVSTADASVPTGCPFKYAARLATRDHYPALADVPFSAVKPGDVWRLSALVACSAGDAPFSLYIQIGSDPSTMLRTGTGRGRVAATASWTRTIWDYTVPAGVYFIRPFLQIEQAANAGTVWFATDWHMEDISAAKEAQATADVTASAVTGLTTRVTNAEGKLDTQATSIINLQTSLTTTNGNVTAAQNAAQAASDLAGGKGKVIYGTTAPAAADRLDQNLWIDTINNVNTPKRWNGTAWVAVTDKVATDAAAAAAAANALAQTKADASTVQSLSNTVAQQGAAITANGAAITNISTSLGQVAGENFVYNSSFEKGGNTPGVADGWAFDFAGGTRAYSLVNSTVAPGVAQRVDLTGMSSTIWCRLASTSNRRVSVDQGIVYTASMYVRAAAGLQIKPQVNGVSSSGAAGTWQQALIVATGDWQKLTVTFTPLATTVEVSVCAVVYGSETVSSGFMEVDQVQVEVGTVATGWRDNGQVNAMAIGAVSTAVDGLSSTVSQQGANLSSVSTRTTVLENKVNSTTDGLATKASTSVVNNLSGRVDATEQGLTSQTQSITALSASIKAANSAGGNIVPNATFDPAYSRMGFTAVATAGAGVPSGCPFKYAAQLTGRDHYPLLADVPFVAVKPGDVWRLSALVACGAGTAPFNLYIQIGSDPNTVSRTGTGGGRISTTSAWTRSTWDYTVPAGVFFIRPFLQIEQPGGGNGTVWYATDWHMEDITVAKAALVGVDANASAITSIQATVTQQGNEISSQSSSITVLQNKINNGSTGLDSKASATSVSALDTKVTQQGSKIESEAKRVDTLITSVNSTNAALQDERTARINADGALGQRIDTTQSNINGVSASVQTISTAQTNLQNQANASYAVKLGVTSNGIYYASGFGTSLVNNNGVLQSTFAVLTDRFVVLNTTNNTLVSPFSIVNGQVIIRDALISQAAIRNAIIGNTLQSAAMTNWASGPEPVMTMDFNTGNVTTRNNTRAQTYSVMNAAGFHVVVDGVMRFRAGTW